MKKSLDDIARQYIERAQKAQGFLKHLTQKEVDRLAFYCGKAVYDHAEELSVSAVTETGLGNVPDKILKKKAKAEATWAEIKDRRTVGIIRRDEEKRMIYMADPVGIIAGVSPCTNPVATAMFYAMICLKTRNALIISPHPRAVKTTQLTLDKIRKALSYSQMPEGVLQLLWEPDLSPTDGLELSARVMSLANMVIATGGPKLVDIAYHSGRPAYGVGAGNTPVYIHPSANIPAAMEKVIQGRAFDNGIICASEQHLIVPREIYPEVSQALAHSGGYLIRKSAEREALSRVVLDEKGHINPEYLGKSASDIARAAGLDAATQAKILVVPVAPDDLERDPYSAEKLCPILSLFLVDTYAEGLDLAERLLNFQGKGHSAAIHIDEKRCEEDLLLFSERMPATHIIVNMPSATSSGGSRYNWMTPSTTLGCGAYGGTMPMESINLSVKQLINYKAVAMPLSQSRIPENTFTEAFGY